LINKISIVSFEIDFVIFWKVILSSKSDMDESWLIWAVRIILNSKSAVSLSNCSKRFPSSSQLWIFTFCWLSITNFRMSNIVMWTIFYKLIKFILKLLNIKFIFFFFLSKGFVFFLGMIFPLWMVLLILKEFLRSWWIISREPGLNVIC